MRIAPDRACKVVVACTVLYNISKEINDPYLGRQHQLLDVEVPDYNGPPNTSGHIARDLLTVNYFEFEFSQYTNAICFKYQTHLDTNV